MFKKPCWIPMFYINPPKTISSINWPKVCCVLNLKTTLRCLVHQAPYKPMRGTWSAKPFPRSAENHRMLKKMRRPLRRVVKTARRVNPIQQVVFQITSKHQVLKIAWQRYSCQALIEIPSKRQALKTAWQVHSFQALVEIIPEMQALKTTWQAHSFQTLVEILPEMQALKTTWQVHSFHTLLEIPPEFQALKVAW